jgi:hypothetical protein
LVVITKNTFPYLTKYNLPEFVHVHRVRLFDGVIVFDELVLLSLTTCVTGIRMTCPRKPKEVLLHEDTGGDRKIVEIPICFTVSLAQSLMTTPYPTVMGIEA